MLNLTYLFDEEPEPPPPAAYTLPKPRTLLPNMATLEATGSSAVLASSPSTMFSHMVWRIMFI